MFVLQLVWPWRCGHQSSGERRSDCSVNISPWDTSTISSDTTESATATYTIQIHISIIVLMYFSDEVSILETL